MQTAATKSELLQKLSAQICAPRETAHVQTGLPALDELAPGGGFRCGAVHELLWPARQQLMPMTFALLLAKSALLVGPTTNGNGAGTAGRTVIAWSDPLRELYPPAVAAAGVDLSRLMLLRPGTPAEELYILAECLRCPAVRATVGVVSKLSQIQARRLQLAAEAGGQLGILMRPAPASLGLAPLTRRPLRHGPARLLRRRLPLAGPAGARL